MIVPHVVNLVQSFKRDGLPSSSAFLVQFSELMHCMIYHYSGFPDLYEPILEALKDLPKPSEEKVKLILNQSAWTSQSNALASCLPRLSGKSETGKTGLINLGNTCYMNSVLQALFMATDFRRHVLSLNLNGCNSLMKKLQHLFAFLAHTQREAYAPQIFFEASRPPWFTPRSQQDCSEYLRFLLDRLHEEEKSFRVLSPKPAADPMVTDGGVQPSPAGGTDVFPGAQNAGWGHEEKTLIESMFGGKLQTTICCLNCRSTSQKMEAFTDLSLAFCPSSDKPGQSMICSPKEKDDDCIEIDIAPSVEAQSVFLNSAQDGNGESTELKSAVGDLQSSSNTSVDTSAHNTLQPDSDMCQKADKDETLSVTDLLNYFLAPEILDGENRYHCEKCASLQNAEKTMHIIEEPEYLILTLLRFSYDPKCHVRRKILDNVSIPLVLELPVERSTSVVCSGGRSLDADVPDVSENLAKKLKPSGIEDQCCTQLVPYVLSSIVVHSGTSSESGHYYSYARNVTSTSRYICHEKSYQGHLVSKETSNSIAGNDTACNDMPKEWFLFNDSRVTFTSFQSVLNITNRFPKDTAYVLLYKKHSYSDASNVHPSSVNGLWVNGEPPLQKELMDAITKDNKLYLQEQELNARARALQAASASCSFRPNGFDDNDPPGSCGPSGGGGDGGFSTISRLVF